MMMMRMSLFLFVCAAMKKGTITTTKKWSFVCIGEFAACLSSFLFVLIIVAIVCVWLCECILCNCSSIGER